MTERFIALDGPLNGDQVTLADGTKFGYDLIPWQEGEQALAQGIQYVVVFHNRIEHSFLAKNDEEAAIYLEENYYAYGGDVTPDDVIWWGRQNDRPDGV